MAEEENNIYKNLFMVLNSLNFVSLFFMAIIIVFYSYIQYAGVTLLNITDSFFVFALNDLRPQQFRFPQSQQLAIHL